MMLRGVSRSGMDVRIWVLEAKFFFSSGVAPGIPSLMASRVKLQLRMFGGLNE